MKLSGDEPQHSVLEEAIKCYSGGSARYRHVLDFSIRRKMKFLDAVNHFAPYLLLVDIQ